MSAHDNLSALMQSQIWRNYKRPELSPKKTLQASINVMAHFMSKMRENYVDGKDIRSSLWYLTRIKDIFYHIIPRLLEN
jgi:hypothetical protein